LETVGELLRKEREKKGFSLKDIENAVNIRVLYLDAIEKGDYHVIPGEVYLKGFIRNYANYLDLNGSEIVNLYRMNQNFDKPAISEPIVPQKKPSNTGKKNLKGRTLLIGLAALTIVLGVSWRLLSSTPSSTTVSTSAQQNQTLLAASPTAKSDEAPQSIVITAKFTDQCWTLITADGKDIYEGIPKNGETMTWKANQTLVIKVGNADAVNLILNGRDVDKIGGKGEVIVKTFSLNSAKNP